MKTLSANPPVVVLAAALAAMLIAAASTPVAAKSSDRNAPMDITAGRTEYVLNENQPTVLSGGVHITQGTLDIRSVRAAITQRDGEPVVVVLTGQPVTLSQKLDDGSPMNATAAKVDYNLRTEVLILTGDVHIKQPDNSLTSDRVVYNLRTGRVTGGGEGAGRVKMRIMPKDNAGSDENAGDADDSGDAVNGNPSDASEDSATDAREDG